MIEYRYLNRISYSALSSFSKKGINAFLKEKEDSYVPWFAVGGLVDSLLTGDHGKILENAVVIRDPISKTQIQVCDYLIENNLELTDENIISAVKNIPVYNNIKDEEKILARFQDPFPLYYKCIKEGKKVVFKSDLILARQIAGEISNNKYYKDLINNCKRAYQVRIEWEFEEEEMLSILDCLFLDDKNKHIYIVDIKTGSRKPEAFVEQFSTYEYDIQASFYLTAVEYLQSKNLLPKDYTLSFHFIYAPTIGDIKSVFVDVSENRLKICKEKWVNLFHNFIITRNKVRQQGINKIDLESCNYRIVIE